MLVLLFILATWALMLRKVRKRRRGGGEWETI
jgi:hypothetical protein